MAFRPNVKVASAYARKPKPISQLTGSSVQGFPGTPRPPFQYSAPAAPGTGPTAASSPAALSSPPASSGSAGLPVDPAYDQTQAALQRQRDNAIAAYQAQRTAGLLNYGYTEGPGGALAFDASNPFSQAALMQRSYDQTRRGTNTSFAAQGQLYSGALQRNRDNVNFKESASKDALMKAVLSFLAGNTANVSKAGTDYDLGLAGAMGDRVGRAPSNPLYSPVVGDASSGASAAPSSSAPAAPKAAAPPRQVIVKPSAAHGGKRWKYYRGASGVLIPIGPA